MLPSDIFTLMRYRLSHNTITVVQAENEYGHICICTICFIIGIILLGCKKYSNIIT